MIQYQIKERDQQRLLDAEKKDQETQAMLKYLERLQEEDMENLQKKRQSQKQLMEEVAQCNEVGHNRERKRNLYMLCSSEFSLKNQSKGMKVGVPTRLSIALHQISLKLEVNEAPYMYHALTYCRRSSVKRHCRRSKRNWRIFE